MNANYKELAELYKNAGNQVRIIEKNNLLHIVEIDSIGSNKDMIIVEFDEKHGVIETNIISPIIVKDELLLYKNINKANLRLDDGVIAYDDEKLVLRNILTNPSIEPQKLAKQIAYLLIVSVAFFTAIIKESEAEKLV